MLVSPAVDGNIVLYNQQCDGSYNAVWTMLTGIYPTSTVCYGVSMMTDQQLIEEAQKWLAELDRNPAHALLLDCELSIHERLIRAFSARLSAVLAEKEEQPTLKSLAHHLGWGNNMSTKHVFEFVVEHELLLRKAQDALNTYLSDAPTAESALLDRIAKLESAEASLTSLRAQVREIEQEMREHFDGSPTERTTIEAVYKWADRLAAAQEQK